MSQTLFAQLTKRSAGVFAHLTSLPSDYGIGTLGKEAKQFIDFLEISGFSYWQVCPVGPTGYGDSPYQSFSAFAGNPYFIDFEELKEKKLINDSSLVPLQTLSKHHTDYGALYKLHEPILREAFTRFQDNPSLLSFKDEYNIFLKKNQEWLIPYSIFKALKKHFNQSPWWEWDIQYTTLEQAKKSRLCKEMESEIELHKFIQFIFFHQWQSLHAYAKAKNIKLIGDIPIFVAHDSADLWSNPLIYKLDADHTLNSLAGVPPDYFSELGQFWGNPLYDWRKARSECYEWWTKRIRHNFKLFDALRLDHFRGFESYWSIPADASDARAGKWLKGPGFPFFKYLSQEFPDAFLIAEDLGIITDEVRVLREKTGLAGMVMLQFAFDGNPENAFLPHNLLKNFVAYAGNHDNNTTRGWYNALSEAQKDQVRRYFRISGKDIAWDFIHALYASTCNLIIITMQDLLNKDSEARLNFPGTGQGNWQWRFTLEELQTLIANNSNFLKELKWLYNR